MAEIDREGLSDEALTRMAVLGDLRSFDVLVKRYRAAVYRVAQIYGTPEAAEDVVQDAFLAAFKALPGLDDHSRFAAWLYAITRHESMRVSRRNSEERKRRVDLDELILTQSEFLALPPAVEFDAVAAWVRAGIDSLQEDFRLVLKLRYYDELPLKRISDFLALPLSTVKWRLHEARRHLKAALAPAPEMKPGLLSFEVKGNEKWNATKS